MNDAETLGKTILLRDLPPAELKQLAAISEQRSIGPGVELLREGQVSDELLIIVMGTVKVTKADENDREEELAVLGTGSYVGELELVSTEHRNAATVVTQEPTTVVVLKRTALNDLCDSNHTLGYHVYRALAQGLSRRLAATDEAAAHYRGAALRSRR